MQMDQLSAPNKLCKLLRESHVDWNQVIQLCKTHKHFAKNKDWKQRTHLHLACIKSSPPPPLAAIRAIIKANKHALTSLDADGMLPIHYICDRGDDSNESLIILKTLIRFCPESILVQDRKGCTPLHRCCESQKSHSFFKCLLDANKSNVTSGKPSMLDLKDEMRRTALHFAVIRALELKVISELIDAAPRTVGMECVRGYCPIHYACSYLEVTYEHIRLLLEQNVRACGLRGNNGLNCLDLLSKTYKEYLDGDSRLRDEKCTITKRNKEQVKGMKFSKRIEHYWMKAMLVAGGASLGRLMDPITTIRSNEAQFIHDLIRLDRCPYTLLSLVVAKYPEWLTVKDANGNLPLHTVSSKFISRKCIANHSQITKIILCGYPDACREKNNDGKYPLTLAIETCKSWDSGLERLFKTFPEALDSLDLDIRLYPFVLSRAASADISAMHKLITLFPSMVPS